MIFLCIIIVSAMIATILKDRIERCIPYVVITMLIITYIFSLMNLAYVSLVIIYALTFFCSGYLFINKKTIEFKNVFSASLMACAFSSAIVLFVTLIMLPQNDTSSISFILTKNFYDTESVYETIKLSNNSAPRLFTMWGYLFEKSLFCWNDKLLAWSKSVLLIMFISPQLEREGSKIVNRSVVTLIVLESVIMFLLTLVIPSDYDNYGYASLYGSLVAVFVWLRHMNDRKIGYYSRLFVLLIAMFLSNKFLVIYLFCVIFVSFVMNILEKLKKYRNCIHSNDLTFIATSTAVLTVIYFIREILDSHVFVKDVANTYLNAISNNERIMINLFFPTSMIQLLAIVYIFALLLKIEKNGKFLTIYIGSIIYVIVIGILYATQYAKQNFVNGAYLTGCEDCLYIMAFALIAFVWQMVSARLIDIIVRK